LRSTPIENGVAKNEAGQARSPMSMNVLVDGSNLENLLFSSTT
jgi:hypothetical protein